jgi:DNA-binding MarR family transcriptional regulator
MVKKRKRRTYNSVVMAIPKDNPLILCPGLRNSVYYPLKLAMDITIGKLMEIDREIGAEFNEVLLMIAIRDEPMGQGSLADALGINRNQMVKLVDIAEKNGTLKREPNPKRRGEWLIVITEKGRKILLRFQTADGRKKLMQKLFPHCTAKDVEALIERAVSLIDEHYKK